MSEEILATPLSTSTAPLILLTPTASPAGEGNCPNPPPPLVAPCLFPCVLDLFVVGVSCWESVSEGVAEKLGEPVGTSINESGGMAWFEHQSGYGEVDIAIGWDERGRIDYFRGDWYDDPQYSLVQLLHDYGSPSEIRMFTYADPPNLDEAWVFDIALIYPQHQLIAMYWGSGDEDLSDAERVHGCIRTQQAYFLVSTIDLEGDFSTIASTYRLFPAAESVETYIQELGTVSTYSIESFVQEALRSKEDEFCFYVEADPWR